MNLKYKELRREAPTRHIMESKHTEAAPPEGRRYGGAFGLYWPMKLMDLPQFWSHVDCEKIQKCVYRGCVAAVLRPSGGAASVRLGYRSNTKRMRDHHPLGIKN